LSAIGWEDVQILRQAHEKLSTKPTPSMLKKTRATSQKINFYEVVNNNNL
jgi:hypothetical protein